MTAVLEPSSNGKLLYLPFAIVKPIHEDFGGGMINFMLELRYKAEAGAPTSLVANTLKVWFPGTELAINTYLLKDGKDLEEAKKRTLADGRSLSIFLDEQVRTGVADPGRGSIRIPITPAPASIRIEVVFDGFDPVVFNFPLQAHANPTSDGSYAFPFKAKDLPEKCYIFADAAHFPDRGQHWGYDFGGYIWNGSKFVHNTGPENEDYPIFGLPVYAGADGVVLKADDSWPDHPRVPLRRILRTGVERGPVGVVSVAAFSPNRIFTAVTDEDGQVLVLSFASSGDAQTLSYLGKSQPGLPFAGDTLSATALTATKLVVAGAANGAAFVSLYSVSADGVQVTCSSTITLPGTASIKIDRYSETQFVMARQPVSGNLEVSLWELAPGLGQKPSFAVSAGGATSLFDLAVLDTGRVVTALQTGASKLKLVVWNVARDDKNKVTALTRGKDCEVDTAVNQIAVAATRDAGRVLVGVRNGEGKLGAYYFQIDAKSGEVALLGSEISGPISRVALARFKRGQTAMAVIGSTDELKLIGYEIRESDNKWNLLRTADYVDPGGAITALDIARIVPNDGENNIETCAVAVRTSSGKLKLILWRQPLGNSVRLLCGDECVTYAHLQQKSIPETLKPGVFVKKGDLIGKAGFSGSTGGPHLHVHCVKVDIDARTLTREHFAAIQNGTYEVSGSPRPMLFHGISALATELLGTPGWEKGPFIAVDDRGFYFTRVAIYPLK
ncbi:M23 family metallopeptidase [Nannocystis exedens]|uniref:M23 family metallopeptidase n=1 Tax=Nannocystis exedens TaxID=54 RepID=UPI001B8065E4|nr:M23 family metallopeptidase [Nannocystis exedens]